MTMTAVAKKLETSRLELHHRIQAALAQRAWEASHALRGSLLQVLSGRRSGRRYRLPMSTRFYTASAPGEAPATRTGSFRLSWLARPEGQVPGVETKQARLADWLQEGTEGRKLRGPMKPRPYVDQAKAKAWSKVQRIYRRPYLS